MTAFLGPASSGGRLNNTRHSEWSPQAESRNLSAIQRTAISQSAPRTAEGRVAVIRHIDVTGTLASGMWSYKPSVPDMPLFKQWRFAEVAERGWEADAFT